MDRATRREERIKHLDEAVAKLRAEQRRLRALTSREERKQDTRRLILMGAMLRDRMERGDLPEPLFKADMDRFLVRDRDRALFGLPLRQSSEKGTTPA
ncbi:MAG: mobilization protein [Acidobacteriota bacterium]|nr:mobilization protein [Acidobacteriota bacterium]